MIKYIGSKRALLAGILEAVARVAPPGSTVLDLFSGTARVGHALKAAGYRVVSNDHNAYAHALATCYVQADRDRWGDTARRVLADLARLPPKAGWFTETFCVRSRFLQPKNGERVDAIREAIAGMGAEPELEAVLLVSLMEAADRVDSTAGLQMAYMKAWAPRSYNDIDLRVPKILDRTAAGPCLAMRGDAEETAAAVEADVAYLDPPYNQHSYLGNYHVWESLVRWDKPEVYGVACKRVDCLTRKSAFNSRRNAAAALERTVRALRCRTLLISFSDEGYIGRAEMEAMLRARGEVSVAETDHARYVGAKIGIHDPKGRVVGKVGRLRNTEYLYVAGQAATAAA